MKISMLVCLLAAGLSVSGQDLTEQITLHMDQQSMKAVLDRIEKQSGLSFSYNSRLINADEAVSIYVEQASLEF